MPATPFRQTVLQLDIGEVILGRDYWEHNRTSGQIAQARKAGVARSQNVWPMPGDAWILKVQETDLSQVVKTDLIGNVVNATDVTLAGGFVVKDMFRKPTDLTGVGTDASVATSGMPAFQKRVAAGASWDSKLTDDTAAMPQPDQETTQNIPLDRVLVGKKTYPENTPWCIRFATPSTWEDVDGMLTFYFGGPTGTDPQAEKAGQWCVTLRGNGEATLNEFDGTAWQFRSAWRWSESHQGHTFADLLVIVPHGTDRIALWSGQALIDLRRGVVPVLVTIAGAAIGAAQAAERGVHLYKETFAEVGHRHLTAASGPGTIRMDLRRDQRMPVSIIKGSYAATGTIVDAPFLTDELLPANTPLNLTIDAYLPPNTSVTGQIYDADTNLPLSTVNGFFHSVSGQAKYYVILTLESSDGVQTPVVYGYKVSVPGEFSSRPNVPTVIENLFGVDITGPDTDPTHEQATVAIKDLYDGAQLLRTRDRIRSLISVKDTLTGDIISHLFEGETHQAEAVVRTGIKPGWHDYPNVHLVGLWCRIAERFARDLKNFARDENAPDDPFWHGKPPWKVTSILRYLLNSCGFADDELDIPDLPIRFASISPLFRINQTDWLLTYGADYSTLIQRLAWDYLRMVLVRDPNAGPRGMWRLLSNPGPPYTSPLASFMITPSSWASPADVWNSATYGVGNFPIRTESLRTWPKAPEANVIRVRGVRTESSGQSWLLETLLKNEDSISGSRSHPDYIGHPVEMEFPPDPSIQTQDDCDWAALTTYDAVAHAQHWAGWESPYVLVDNSIADPLQFMPFRPLRINDLVYLGGLPFLIRSANPRYDRSDEWQWCYYEGQWL